MACVATASLGGCATQQPEPAGLAKHLCRTWSPITISRNDKLTDQTAKEIAGSNAANETWCGKRELVKEPKQIAEARK